MKQFILIGIGLILCMCPFTCLIGLIIYKKALDLGDNKDE